MKMIRFTVESLSPGMLQNPATPELLEQLRTKTPVQKRTDWSVTQESSTKLYRSENGKMGFPTQNLMSAMVLSGQHVKAGKKAISTAKSTILYDFLEFVEDFCEFQGCVPVELSEQEVQSGKSKKFDIPWSAFPVKGTMHQGASETAVCIVRPRIPHWTVTFTVRFDDKRGIGLDVVEKLVETTGRKIGLCDWRPAKRGRFGRFIIKKVETFDVPTEELKIERVTYTNADVPADLKALVTSPAVVPAVIPTGLEVEG